MRVVVSLMAGGLVLAGPAGAVTFFSVGGAPDPGLASFETSLADFDAPLHAGIALTTAGPVGVYTGSSGVAAAPAGDATAYMGIGTGGSATFDLRGYFAAAARPVRSLSAYLGSIDRYNFIDVLDGGGNVVATLAGGDLPGNDGDQGAALSNRRLFINFDPSEDIAALTFRSSGVAFEFDGLAASSAIYRNNGDQAPYSMPPATAVPEPATWALMLAGFGMVGAAARRRGRVRTVSD